MRQHVQVWTLSTSPLHLLVLLNYCSPRPVLAPLANLAWQGPNHNCPHWTLEAGKRGTR